MTSFRYGIEHEVALKFRDGGFADFVTLPSGLLERVVAELPAAASDVMLHRDNEGIKQKRWYIEGFERFRPDGSLWLYVPKGLEVRTHTHDSIDVALEALAADIALMDSVLLRHGLEACILGFNPVRAEFPISPPLSESERQHRLRSPEERTEYLHMLTYGPDLNISANAIDPIVSAQKLTYYSPWIVPLSFSSPFRNGVPWGGFSARTHLRTGARPAALAYLPSGDRRMLSSDPSLTKAARLPAEVGRIEFKACDAIGDLALYGEMLSLLTGLVLDTTLPGRATVPDAAAHRHVAVAGLDDDDIHAGTGALLDAARRALADRPADQERLAALRKRWARRDCPAKVLLADPPRF